MIWEDAMHDNGNRLLLRLLIAAVILLICMLAYPYFYCPFTNIC